MTTTVDQHKGPNGNQQSLGAQAAAAAGAPATPIKPVAEVQPPTVVVEGATDTDDDDDAAADDGEAKDARKKRTTRNVYVCVGEVREFPNNREAEKYLNEDGAPTSFDVIKGNRLVRRQRVTLE